MWERFSRYYLTKQVDSKSPRSIYLAHHVNDVSQKVMLEIFDAACFTFDQQSENIFQKIEMIKQLKHSSIIPILDLGVEQGRPYVVREYHTYNSLLYHLDHLSSQRLNWQEALLIIQQAGQGLSYAHQHHILHGCIKPETIFFNNDGEVLLSDFGLASFIDMTKFSQKSDPRATSYKAPEQLVGSLTEKSDQYALACLAYELITGCIPFSAQSTFSVTFPTAIKDISGKAIKRGKSKNRDQIAQLQAGDFCENSQCPDYGEVGKNNISKYGKTRKGEQRWRCKTCQATWSFSSTWAKQHPEFLIPPSNLAPDLPDVVQKAVLKAMANDPSDRFADVSLFLKALETASPVAAPVISSSALVASSDSTLVTTLAKPLENRASELPLPTKLNEAPATTHLIERSEHGYHRYDSGKALVTLARNTYEASPRDRLPHTRKSPTPTLWVAFALSGIVLLLGTVVLYILVPLRSPGSIGPLKDSSTTPVTATITNPTKHVMPTTQSIPTIQPTPTIQSTPIALAVQPTLTGRFAEQKSQMYNLTTEGRLDWVDWGLNTPADVNRKRGVQEQISTFTLIGNGTIQRDDNYSNAYIWSDGTPVASEDPGPNGGVYGIYVDGLHNGFTISVQASTTPRTLRLYIGTKLAQGKLTASLAGQTYTDTALDTTTDPHNSQDNGIYTLAFNSSVPNQILTVTYTAIATNGSNGATFLQAATLQ